MSRLDSTAVNKEIRLHKPLLQKAGFSEFTSRTSWRYRPNRIDVLNFQSFNSYLANSVGCTTYSFAVNLGCYLTYIPNQFAQNRFEEKEGRLLPLEYNCHLRCALHKQLKQPELSRKSIWYVDPQGKYLGPAVYDAALVIENKAWKWFERWSDDAEVLRTLLKDREDKDGAFGFGVNPSPARSYFTAYTAMFLNAPEIAIPHFQRALASGCFPQVKEQLERDLESALGAGENQSRG